MTAASLPAAGTETRHDATALPATDRSTRADRASPHGRARGTADVLTDRAAGGRRSGGWRDVGRRALASLALALAVAAGTLAPAAPAQAQNQAQPPLPTVQLSAGIHLIQAEVADSFDTRMRGLMFRQRLGPNEGMLFVFKDRSEQCFWMKNTILPLSIAFIDDDGTIANIADMKPLDESSHCSARPVRFALEMEQGWFAKRGIKAGVKMGGEKVFGPAR